MDIGANFYPELGSYSSYDPNIIDIHFKQIKETGVDVVSISWWGIDSFEDKILNKLFNSALKYGLKVNIHFEPFYKTENEFLTELNYLEEKYSQHPTFYKFENESLYFIYDSYKFSSEQWINIFNKSNHINFIGLIRDLQDTTAIIQNGFKGCYSYFVAKNFTEASNPENWELLNNWTNKNDKLFIPSVGPGYVDTRVRPWNDVNTKERNNGKYYDEMFAYCINSKVENIAITSFNEWHEGTQIEPAIPFKIEGFIYDDYQPLNPDYYLKRTKFWLNNFESNTEIELDNYINNKEVLRHKAFELEYSLGKFEPTKYSKDAHKLLTDGELGSIQFNDGNWLGLETDDLIIALDFQNEKFIEEIKINFLNRQRDWIFLPEKLELEIIKSESNTTFEKVMDIIQSENEEIITFKLPVDDKVKSVIFTAKNIGVCPEWHIGVNKPAWIFIDEIIIE